MRTPSALSRTRATSSSPTPTTADRVTLAVFCPTGRFALTSTLSSTTPLLHRTALTPLRTPPLPLRGHSGAVLSAAFSPTSSLLTASRDATVRLWAPGQAACLRVFAHADAVTALAWLPPTSTTGAARFFLSASADAAAHVWDAKDGGRAAQTRVDRGKLVTAAAFFVADDDRRADDDRATPLLAVLGTYDGALQFYDVRLPALQHASAASSTTSPSPLPSPLPSRSPSPSPPPVRQQQQHQQYQQHQQQQELPSQSLPHFLVHSEAHSQLQLSSLSRSQCHSLPHPLSHHPPPPCAPLPSISTCTSGSLSTSNSSLNHGMSLPLPTTPAATPSSAPSPASAPVQPSMRHLKTLSTSPPPTSSRRRQRRRPARADPRPAPAVSALAICASGGGARAGARQVLAVRDDGTAVAACASSLAPLVRMRAPNARARAGAADAVAELPHGARAAVSPDGSVFFVAAAEGGLIACQGIRADSEGDEGEKCEEEDAEVGEGAGGGSRRVCAVVRVRKGRVVGAVPTVMGASVSAVAVSPSVVAPERAEKEGATMLVLIGAEDGSVRLVEVQLASEGTVEDDRRWKAGVVDVAREEDSRKEVGYSSEREGEEEEGDDDASLKVVRKEAASDGGSADGKLVRKTSAVARWRGSVRAKLESRSSPGGGRERRRRRSLGWGRGVIDEVGG